MTRLLEGIVDQEYIPIVTWIILAAIAVAVVYATYRIIRLLTAGTFISGGRNRKTRLAVMDATAVDERRRLVLVRRDDVEHLILIGGPTDVVIEQDIRMIARAARPIAGDNDVAEAPDHPGEAVTAPRPTPPMPVSATPIRSPLREAVSSALQRDRPLVSRTPVPARTVTPPPHQPTSRPAPPVSVVPTAERHPPRADAQADHTVEFRRDSHRPGLAAHPRPAAVAPLRSAGAAASATLAVRHAPENDIDSALLQELEDSLDIAIPEQNTSADDSLEDEMTKLLGELSRDRK